MADCTIGVDISKATLDAHRLADGAWARFDNDRRGFRALLAWIGTAPSRVIFEPTGAYHRAFERALAAAGVPLAKVNPRQARRFAEATGRLAKTDRLDAALLARMGALLELPARPPRTEMLGELKDLHVARGALVKDRTAAMNRAKSRTLPLLRRQGADRLRQIRRQIAELDAEILRRLQADPQLSRRFDILVSIPGVAKLTAFALLIDMSGAPSSFRCLSWSASIRTSRPARTGSKRPANPRRSFTPLSCGSSSSSPTLFSRTIERGALPSPDHYGYSSRVKNGFGKVGGSGSSVEASVGRRRSSSERLNLTVTAE